LGYFFDSAEIDNYGTKSQKNEEGSHARNEEQKQKENKRNN